MKQIFIALTGVLLSTAAIAQQPAKPTAVKPATTATATKPASTVKAATSSATTSTTKIATKLAQAISSYRNNIDSASYALGARIAQTLKTQGFDKLDMAIFQKAMNDVLQNKKLVIAEDVLDKCIGEYQQKASAQKSIKGKTEGTKFLAENGKRKGVITTKSGLQYEVIKNSTDTAKPTLTDKVKCHYHGTLLNGTVFDSSVDRGEPISFPVNGVIPGWTEALQLMTVGSKWKLYIPSELAYGDRSAGPTIEPGSTLIFEVEILAIEK
jgi:FKBP-type peptidyl-prolyl cis-trans isomerase FklB